MKQLLHLPCYRNLLQNGQRFVKNDFKQLVFFCQKAQNFVQFGPHDLVQISPACGTNTYQICMERLYRLAVSAFATVARNSFNGNTAKIDFLIGHCILPLLTLTSEV